MSQARPHVYSKELTMQDNTRKQKGFGVIDALIVAAAVLIAAVLFYELAGPKKAKRDIEWRRSVLFALERAEMNYENDLQAHLDVVAELEAERLREAEQEEPAEETQTETEEAAPADSSVSESEEPEPEDTAPKFRVIADLGTYLRDVEGIAANPAGYEFRVELTTLGCIVSCLKDGVILDQISEGKPSWEIAEISEEAEPAVEVSDSAAESEVPDSSSAVLETNSPENLPQDGINPEATGSGAEETGDLEAG